MAILTNDFLTNGFLTNGKTPYQLVIYIVFHRQKLGEIES
jgi:hypothetical protein